MDGGLRSMYLEQNQGCYVLLSVGQGRCSLGSHPIDEDSLLEIPGSSRRLE